MKPLETSSIVRLNYICWIFICISFVLSCQSEPTSSSSKEISEEDFEAQELSTEEKELRSKIRALLGEELNMALIAYRKETKEIQNINDFSATYIQGLQLRDTLVELLGQYIESLEPDSLPDLFWLKEAMPMYQPQLVAEGTSYYLFNDYRQWLEKAEQTAAKEDNDFVALNIALFPDDSIEYFYPVWFMQTWDYGGSSLLGRKKHQSLLSQATRFYTTASDTVFKQEIMKLKEDLVNDILSKENNYWEQQKAILVELDTIISSKYTILSPNDLIALQKRRAEFAEPEKYDIQLNQQAGE